MGRSRRLVSLLGVVAMVASVFVAGGSPASATLPGDTGSIFGIEYGLQDGESGILRWASPTEFGEATTDCANSASSFSIAPDGNSIVYACDFEGDQEIFFLNLVTHEELQLTSNDVDDRDPAFSPDASRIALSTEDLGRRICVITLATEEQECITSPNGLLVDTAPAWNPTGNDELAFVSNRDGDFDIWTITIGDESPVNISNTIGNEFGPNWSPNGGRLAYSSTDIGGLDQVVVQTLASGMVDILTESTETGSYEPAWSPDGDFLVFTNQAVAEGSESRLMVMPSEGGTPTILPNQNAEHNYDHGEWQAFGEGTPCLPECPIPEDPRAITLDIKKFKAKGQVSDDFGDARCIDGVKVRIQRKKKGKWNTVSTDRTGPEGMYSAGVPEKLGRYRATVARKQTDDELPVICLAAQSEVVRIS